MQVMDRAVVAMIAQPFARNLVPKLGPLAKREQRLVTSNLCALYRDGQYLFRREIRLIKSRRWLRKRGKLFQYQGNNLWLYFTMRSLGCE